MVKGKNTEIFVVFFGLEISLKKANTYTMDAGQTVFIISQLVLGAAAAFLAIMLWPGTRDVAWMLIIIGTIVTYIETVYYILNIFGISGLDFIYVGTVPIISFILPIIRMIIFIAAFAIMIRKQYRRN